MTTETPKPVEVTQADRDAAADVAEWQRDTGWEPCFFHHAFATGAREGTWDNHDLVQAFARHRLSTRPEAQSLPTVSSVDLVVRFLDPGIGSLLDDGSLNRETSGRYAQVAERARELLAALSPTVSEAPEDDLERIAIEDLAQRVRQMRIAGEELAALSPTVSEADGLAGAVERALLDIEGVLQATPERSDFVDDLAQQQDAALCEIHEISQKALKALRAQPSNEAEGWRDIASAPKDGSEILILAHGMAIQARYCPGRWGDETPDHPAEYDGAVWCAFDDAVQFEIEEGVGEHGEDWNGPVTHWRPLLSPTMSTRPIFGSRSA